MGNIHLNLFKTLRPTTMTSAALVAILALTFFLRLLFFGQYIDPDVGNIGYMGWRMAEGEVLIDLEGPGKPPLYPMFYALFVLLFGPSVLGLKMFGTLFVLLAVIAIYWVANQAYGEKVGLLSALLFGVFSSGPMVEGGTVNLETVLHFPSILAIGFFLKASITGRLKWYFLAGLCAAMAALVKQVGGVLFFAFLCSWLHENWRKKEWFFRFGLLGAGALAPVIGVILFYSFHGYTLNELYESILGSNFRYLQRGYEYTSVFKYFLLSMKLILQENSLLWLGALFSSAYIGWRIWHGRGELADRILLWWTFWSFSVLWVSGIFYAHYFLQLIAPFSIMAAYGIRLAWKLAKNLSHLPRFVAQGLWAIILVITVALFVKTDYKYFFTYTPVQQTAFQFKGVDGVHDGYGYGVYNIVQHQIALYIRGCTDPADTIYVWGIAPQVYFLAQRIAATRYRNNFNLSTVVTNNAFEALRAYAPKVMEEIRISPPAYIIEIMYLENFPELETFVKNYYEIDLTLKLPTFPYRIHLHRRHPDVQVAPK
ncbi:MAG: glycosyltransferase family 39 protein [Thermodesulfobacteriota bacterium]|nr:glycosyltransferase family 39 protein [Thermodesulfobacteriota bacterium]